MKMNEIYKRRFRCRIGEMDAWKKISAIFFTKSGVEAGKERLRPLATVLQVVLGKVSDGGWHSNPVARQQNFTSRRLVNWKINRLSRGNPCGCPDFAQQNDWSSAVA